MSALDKIEQAARIADKVLPLVPSLQKLVKEGEVSRHLLVQFAKGCIEEASDQQMREELER